MIFYFFVLGAEQDERGIDGLQGSGDGAVEIFLRFAVGHVIGFANEVAAHGNPANETKQDQPIGDDGFAFRVQEPLNEF